MILNYFGHPIGKQNLSDHTCCDFNQKKCKCDVCLSIKAETEAVRRNIESVQCSPTNPQNQLREDAKKSQYYALVAYRLTLHGSRPSCVGGLGLATGFNIELIDKIVDHATEL